MHSIIIICVVGRMNRAEKLCTNIPARVVEWDEMKRERNALSIKSANGLCIMRSVACVCGCLVQNKEQMQKNAILHSPLDSRCVRDNEH